MTFLIAFPFIAGSLAVLLLHSDRARRHPARNEEALIAAPIPGLLVPPGNGFKIHFREGEAPAEPKLVRIAWLGRSLALPSQFSEIRFGATSNPELQGTFNLCRCRPPVGGSNRT